MSLWNFTFFDSCVRTRELACGGDPFPSPFRASRPGSFTSFWSVICWCTLCICRLSSSCYCDSSIFLVSSFYYYISFLYRALSSLISVSFYFIYYSFSLAFCFAYFFFSSLACFFELIVGAYCWVSSGSRSVVCSSSSLITGSEVISCDGFCVKFLS